MNGELQKRYLNAAHAMQSGVAYQMASNPENAATTPKHLRVGVNSAHVSQEALAKLCIEKGIFTFEEYEMALCEAMEKEVRRYEVELGAGVKLG